MSDESIFREVNEELRRDQLRKLWDRYGIFVLAVAVAIVLGVAGYNGWQYWQSHRAAEAGSRFIGALALSEDGKSQEARAAFEELAEAGPRGYRLLARFQLAAAMTEQGDRAAALESYEALARESAAGAVLQDYAKVRAAALRVDEADMSEMTERVGAVADGDSPWKHSARELLGLAAFRTGDMDRAAQFFNETLSDTDAPQGVRQRAEMMLALIVRADGEPTAN